MKRTILVLAGAIGLWLAGAVSGCAPVIESHGYAPDDALLADVAVGQDTRGSVRRKIGRPATSGIIGGSDWFYVSTKIEKYTYHEPKVIDRRIVAVSFDANDVVASVNTYGVEDGRIIDLQTRTTPTHGRQLTILQQLLGNLGNIGAEDLTQ